MRKSLFMASFAALAMMVACQKEAPVAEKPSDVIDDNVPVAMQLGINAPVLETKVATKAAGTVGSTEAAANKWNGEKLYIYAFEKDKGYATAFIDNLLVTAPADKPASGTEGEEDYVEGVPATNTGLVVGLVQPAGNVSVAGEPYYYQGEKVYDFYGYYIDDACATAEYGESSVPVPDLKKETVKIPFVINGGQDLMIAKTDKDADLTTATGTVPPSKLYSAYSARRSVKPNLQFKHVLSRFTFEVKAGAPSAGDVVITDLAVKSLYKGTLNLVGETDDISPVEGETKYLSLMEKEGATLKKLSEQGFEIVYENDKSFKKESQTVTAIGESLMVIPGEETYDLTLKMRFRDKTKEEVEAANGTYDANNPVKISNQAIEDLNVTISIDDVNTAEGITKGSTFEAGKSYKITLVVYGPEKIEVIATLNKWEYVGGQTIDPDKDVEGYVEFSYPTMTIDAAGLTDKVVKVYSDAAWTVSETSDWLTLGETTTGTNNGSFTFTAEPNESTDPREAEIILYMTDKTDVKATLVVTQKGKPAGTTEPEPGPVVPVITPIEDVTLTTADVGETGQITVEVTPDATLSVVDNADWLDVAIQGKTITYTVTAANASTTLTNTAIVTVTPEGGVAVTFDIIQPAAKESVDEGQ